MPHRPRRPSAETLDRRRQAVELRLAGLSYVAIAAQLGYRSHSGARQTVEAGLAEAIREPAEEVRQQELARLDQLLNGVWARAIAGSIPHVDVALRISARRCTLLGLDKVRVDVNASLWDPELGDLDAAAEKWGLQLAAERGWTPEDGAA